MKSKKTSTTVGNFTSPLRSISFVRFHSFVPKGNVTQTSDQKRILGNSSIKMSSTDDDSEEQLSLVIDNGSGMIKAGFAGDDSPRAVFPTVVGRRKYNISSDEIAMKLMFIGDEAVWTKCNLKLNFPIEDGG